MKISIPIRIRSSIETFRYGAALTCVAAVLATQNAAASSMVGKLVDGVFDGSASRLAVHLVEAGQLSADELTELRKLIDSNRVSRKGAKAQRT